MTKKTAKKVQTKKVEAKKTQTKKTMKKIETKKTPDFGAMRKLFNKVLTKNKDLVLVENKHGAIQVKRKGGLLFSARKDGKMIITHPMFKGKGKKKERIYKHMGTGFDHLSHVPFEEVTLEMLMDRVKDKKSVKEHHDAVYSGRRAKESGVLKKLEAAKARIAKTKKVAKKTTKKAKNAKAAIKRSAKKAPKKSSPKNKRAVKGAIRAVAKA